MDQNGPAAGRGLRNGSQENEWGPLATSLGLGFDLRVEEAKGSVPGGLPLGKPTPLFRIFPLLQESKVLQKRLHGCP